MSDVATAAHSIGRVLAVHGAVVDVAFDGGVLPKINEAVVVERDRAGSIEVEVQAHLDAGTVRGVALQSTAGLRRGERVVECSVLQSEGIDHTQQAQKSNKFPHWERKSTQLSPRAPG